MLHDYLTRGPDTCLVIWDLNKGSIPYIILYIYILYYLTYRERQELIARRHQVRLWQDGQAGVRRNERRLYSHSKERVDHSPVGQINGPTHGRAVRGRGAGRGGSGRRRGKFLSEIGANLFAKVPNVNKTLN